MPGNCSPQKPQRHHELSDTSDKFHTAITCEHTNTSEGFCSLAESARARHAAAPVRERRHGPDTTEKVVFTRSARDDTLTSHARRNEVEATRGRRTPAPLDEVPLHCGRDRSNRHDDALPSRTRSSRSRSPFKRSRSPDKAPHLPRSMTADSDLPERRRNPRPAIIDVDTARQCGSVSKKAIVVESVSQNQSHVTLGPNTPPTPLRRVPRTISPSTIESEEDKGSSYYSEEEFGQAHPSYVSPLCVRKGDDSGNNSVLRSHNAWGKSTSPERPYERYPRSPQRFVILYLFLLSPLKLY